MTQSTRLLFKMIRIRLALGIGAAFLIFLALALFQPPLDKEYLPLLLLIGLLLAFCMRLHGLLSQTLFPVSDRQVAWIPLAVAGIVTLAGAAGLITGQMLSIVTGRINFYDTVIYWLSTIWVIPPILFFLLFIWRVIRISPGYFGIVGLLPNLF